MSILSFRRVIYILEHLIESQQNRCEGLMLAEVLELNLLEIELTGRGDQGICDAHLLAACSVAGLAP